MPEYIELNGEKRKVEKVGAKNGKQKNPTSIMSHDDK